LHAVLLPINLLRSLQARPGAAAAGDTPSLLVSAPISAPISAACASPRAAAKE
jgi:hypothetical protein